MFFIPPPDGAVITLMIIRLERDLPIQLGWWRSASSRSGSSGNTMARELKRRPIKRRLEANGDSLEALNDIRDSLQGNHRVLVWKLLTAKQPVNSHLRWNCYMILIRSFPGVARLCFHSCINLETSMRGEEHPQLVSLHFTNEVLVPIFLEDASF